MAWEIKGNNRYYTRSRRENGRVVREYIGNGPAAEVEELIVKLNRLNRAERFGRESAQREEWAEIDRQVADYDAAVTAVLHAAMRAAGYRRYKGGAWRKIRGK